MIIGGKTLQVPIIQGGMGVGVSLGRLAGAVAKCGGIGVISSVNAGYKDPNFLKNPLEANLNALKKNIMLAKEIASGAGLIAVNIMTAVSHYAETCKCAVEAGADLIISGAGLPLKLPEYIKGSSTLFAPIVSSGRAAKLLLKQYEKNYGVKPDMFIIEGHMAGGHLGFSKDELANKTAQSNNQILKDVLAVCEDVPVFVAGGVYDGKDMAHFIKLGASGVQIGTRFIATQECDADVRFKEAIIDAKAEDIVIIASPVGMPARAINSPLLKRIKDGEKFLAKRCNNCLVACPKNENTPYCISRALIEAVQGNWEDGLFFTGENGDKVDRMYSVEELIDEIMSEYESEMKVLVAG